jgi:hypothetical protein
MRTPSPAEVARLGFTGTRDAGDIAPQIHPTERTQMRKALVATVGVIGLALGGSCLSASAATVKGKRIERSFTEVAVGARISVSGSRFENVYRVKQSPDGGGGVIQDGQLEGSTFPVNGHDGTITFFRDGARTTKDTFTLGVPGTDGIGTITGKGICTGGTGFHKFETCTYAFKGTYDLNTSVTRITITGTDTRAAKAPFH